MQLNPHLLATAVPPIPEAKGWTRRYDGSAGAPIDLSQAVPGYPAHPDMLARLAAAAGSRAAAAYGDIAGDPGLRAAYAAHVGELSGTPIAAENVAITAGCNQAFYVATIALAKAGDAIMLPSPWYFNHKMTLDMLGIEAVALPCRAEAGFVPAVAEARRLIHDRVRAIVLVTPNNPTGAIYPPETIAGFQALCAERGIALILDETYRDFVDTARRSYAGPDGADRGDPLIQLYSFSKSYCIPGHRLGALVAGADLVEEIGKILDCVQICAPRAGQLVLPWAIGALADWREANRLEILARAQAFRTALAKVDGWKLRSIGAYFAYLEHPCPDRTGADVAEWLAGERGVLALPGSYFGPGQERFLRVAFANVDAAAIGDLPGRLRDAPQHLAKCRHAAA